MCINISGNVSIPSLRQPSIPGVLCVRCPYLGGEGTSVVGGTYRVCANYRSMNKSACLSDIIDSVRHLEEAMRIDIGVMSMCSV